MKEKLKQYLNKHIILKKYARYMLKMYRALDRKIRIIFKKKKPFVSEKKIIYFDVTSYSVTDVKTGIQRVVNKFLQYLYKSAEGYEIVCVSGLGGYHIINNLDFSPVDSLIIQPKPGDIYLSIDFNPVQPYEYWSTLKKWQDKGCKIYGCVYDLVYEKYPQFMASQEAQYLLSRWLKHATTNYDGLICISKTVEEELLTYIRENNIQNPKLQTGYFWLGGDFGKSKKSIDNCYFSKMCKTRLHSFLAVSTIEPRKGYLELIEAFEKAMENGANIALVIVGRTGWKHQEIVEKMIHSKYYNERIFWFSDCDDELLDVIYQTTDYYISNSYYEGFGLGIIEASSKGAPIVVRDIPINREVTKGMAEFFKNGEDLTKLLLEISDGDVILGTQNTIKALSWKESVDMAWKAINEMIVAGD